MANWSLPGLTDLYTSFLTYIKARDDDATRMNDSRVTAATNLPDYAKRWDDTSKTFKNCLSGIWSNIVLAVAGGGTGASNPTDARTNLGVYSTAQVDAAIAAGHTYAQVELTADVTLTSVNTDYTGPSTTLAAGTWLIIGTLQMFKSSISQDVQTFARIKIGSSYYATATHYMNYVGGSDTPFFQLILHYVAVIGSSSTVSVVAQSNVAGMVISKYGSSGNASNLIAIKIA